MTDETAEKPKKTTTIIPPAETKALEEHERETVAEVAALCGVSLDGALANQAAARPIHGWANGRQLTREQYLRGVFDATRNVTFK
jgi:hypothetical protein